MRLLNGRWLRGRVLVPERTNLVAGLPYTMAVAPSNNGAQADRHLTNNLKPDGTTGSFGRFDCHSWNDISSTVVFDLGEPMIVREASVAGIVNLGGGIRSPQSLSLSSSHDNATWVTRASTSLPAEVGTVWEWVTDLSAVDRYWRVSQTPRSGLWTALGEVQLFDR